MPEILPLEIHSLSQAYFPFDLHRPQSCLVILLSHQLSSKILCWQQANLGKITKGTSSNSKSKEKGYNKNITNSILVEGGSGDPELWPSLHFGQWTDVNVVGASGGWVWCCEAAFSLLSAFQCIEAMHTCLTQDQLVVEWQSSALEVDMWVVEWVPDLDTKPLAISWESVSHARNWTIQQGSQCGPHRFLLCRVHFRFHQF